MEGVSAHPLTWPTGRPRTSPCNRKPTTFKSKSGRGWMEPIGMVQGRERMQRELELVRASYSVLSTNIELRLDGQPRAGRPEPDDPGVALYFRLRQKPFVLACDRWTTVAGNIAAIAAHIEALRGQERWGVGSIEQAFAGFAALPPPMVVNDWRVVLGDPLTLAEAEAAYRARMKSAHPDVGGSDAAAAVVNAAIAMARQVLK